MAEYTARDYASMLGDPTRMAAYTTALQQTITPDTTVLDLGCGSGYFTVLAAKLGAKHVFAIEPNKAITLAKELARENGVMDRITFFQKFSDEISLPEQVDIVVSDLRGILPQHQGNIEGIIDARNNFLKPGGILMPYRDHLWCAPARDPEVHNSAVRPWNASDCTLLKMTSLSKYLIHGHHSRSIPEDGLVSEAKLWGTIDYATDTKLDHRNTLSWTIETPNTAHGIYLWFDSLLLPGVSYNYGPGIKVVVYGAVFFPWPEELHLEAGDHLAIDLSVHLGSEGYEWTWISHYTPHSKGKPALRWSQSTFLDEEGPSKSDFTAYSPDHQTRLGKRGKIALSALKMMEQNLRNDEIANALATEFPEAKKSSASWLKFIAELAITYQER